jgi:capsule polysaccharide export protein KpsE/RkpR
VIPQILKTLPLFWFIVILLIVRWFHGIASDPRIETIDSSFEPKPKNVSPPSSMMGSTGMGNRAAA